MSSHSNSAIILVTISTDSSIAFQQLSTMMNEAYTWIQQGIVAFVFLSAFIGLIAIFIKSVAS